MRRALARRKVLWIHSLQIACQETHPICLLTPSGGIRSRWPAGVLEGPKVSRKSSDSGKRGNRRIFLSQLAWGAAFRTETPSEPDAERRIGRRPRPKPNPFQIS